MAARKKEVFRRPVVEPPPDEIVEADQPMRFYRSDEHTDPPDALRVQIGGLDILVEDALGPEEVNALESMLVAVENAVLHSAGFRRDETPPDTERPPRGRGK